MDSRENIKLALIDVLETLDIHVLIPKQLPIEFPEDLSRGDFATGIALMFAKQVGKNPRALAEEIVEKLKEKQIEGVGRIEAAGAGFINFTLTSSAVAENIEKARTDDMWGSNRHNLTAQDQVLIEYTSPNLFKPLHIGNLVGNILGESIARIWQFNGADVKRINYPSDIGLPAAKVVWGIKKTGGDPDEINSLGEAYRIGNAEYETNSDVKQEINTINKKLYDQSDPELAAIRKKGIETSRKHIDDLCARLGTVFDLEIFESEAAPIGKDIVLKNPDLFPLSDGARVFRGEEHGLHTRVFLNSAGLPTYEAKDLGNFVIKQKKFPNWQWHVVVTGVEQKEYFAVLYKAIEMVFPETQKKTLKYIPTGLLTPTTGKMSSRLGNVITAESFFAELVSSASERAAESRADDKDLLSEQVAVAALKYEVLKQGSGKNITFDREKALNLEGDSGPYLQYAFARTCAILAKAHEAHIAIKADPTAEPNVVARLLIRFPEIVNRAGGHYEPHFVTTYLLEVASAFNSWYAQEQILDGTPAAAHKVAVVNAVRNTLKNGLWILGIPAPEKM